MPSGDCLNLGEIGPVFERLRDGVEVGLGTVGAAGPRNRDDIARQWDRDFDGRNVVQVGWGWMPWRARSSMGGILMRSGVVGAV